MKKVELRKYSGLEIAKDVNACQTNAAAKKVYVELSNVIDVIDYSQNPENEPCFTAKDKKDFAECHKDLMKEIRKALK